MTSLSNRLWSLRQNPRKVLRGIGGAAAALIAGLLLFSQVAGQIFTVVWYLLSMVLLVLAVVFGSYNSYTIARLRGLAARWALGLAIVAIVVLWPAILQSDDSAQLFHNSVAGLIFWFSALFVVLLLSLFFGAAIGAMAGYGRTDIELIARTGMHAWGLGLVFLVFMTGLDDKSDYFGVNGWLKACLPVWTLGLCLLVQRPALHPKFAARQVITWLDRRLIWKRQRHGIVYTEDLRGAALGVVAGLLALMLSATGLVLPLQLQGLRFLVQLRNSGFLFGGLGQDENQVADRQQMVLLELDASMRSDALRDRSEAAIQAEMIRKLASAGAMRIVLPLPALRVDQPRMRSGTAANTEAPEPTAKDIARSIQDLPKLLEAMRAARNVVLAIPGPSGETFSVTDQSLFDQLKEATHEYGVADLESYRVPWLTAIPVQWGQGPPPVPVVLVLAYRLGGKTNVNEMAANIPAWLATRYPRVADNRILVDYPVVAPGRDFPRTTYSSVLRGNSLYVKPAVLTAASSVGARDKWLPGPNYFRGRIVFLDSLAWRQISTPIGTMSNVEVLAHSTAALAGSTCIQKAHPLFSGAGVLAFGLLAGHLCVRRDPLRASWRLGLALLLFLTLVGLVFNLTRQWFDPVTVFLTAVGAFLLVTQFTFSLEHDALQRNRALLQRFVAPQVVEELLEDPENKLGLGGRRQNICVLFADVRNFTPFAEQHTPEEVIEVINSYMTALTESLHAYGGLLDKYTGDGLMAIFRVTGDPPDEEIKQSVRAALAMRDAARAISARMSVQGQTPLEVGISLHYGEAVVGLVGNPNQFNYTALGHTVVVSARLQTIAKGGEIVVSDAIYAAIAEEFKVVEGEPVQVKGLSQPVRPYRVLALATPALRPRASAPSPTG